MTYPWVYCYYLIIITGMDYQAQLGKDNITLKGETMSSIIPAWVVFLGLAVVIVGVLLAGLVTFIAVLNRKK